MDQLKIGLKDWSNGKMAEVLIDWKEVWKIGKLERQLKDWSIGKKSVERLINLKYGWKLDLLKIRLKGGLTENMVERLINGSDGEKFAKF